MGNTEKVTVPLDLQLLAEGVAGDGDGSNAKSQSDVAGRYSSGRRGADKRR